MCFDMTKGHEFKFSLLIILVKECLLESSLKGLEVFLIVNCHS